MANFMLMHTLTRTLVQLKHFSHVHQRSVGDARCGGERGVARQRPRKGGTYWSPCVPMGRARSGKPQEPLWGCQGPEIEGKQAIYGFTDFRGKPEKRGRGSHASASQVTAGLADAMARAAGLKQRAVTVGHFSFQAACKQLRPCKSSMFLELKQVASRRRVAPPTRSTSSHSS